MAVKDQLASGHQRVRQAKTKFRLLSEAVLQCQEMNGVPATKWTKAHPEERCTDVSEWVRNDWGIWLADRMAANDMKAVREAGCQCRSGHDIVYRAI